MSFLLGMNLTRSDCVVSADHLVFQDPVLHNRRVISLNKVTELKRVPVELRHARMLLSQLPGMAMLSKGGILGSLVRLAGFKIPEEAAQVRWVHFYACVRAADANARTAISGR